MCATLTASSVWLHLLLYTQASCNTTRPLLACPEHRIYQGHQGSWHSPSCHVHRACQHIKMQIPCSSKNPAPNCGVSRRVTVLPNSRAQGAAATRNTMRRAAKTLAGIRLIRLNVYISGRHACSTAVAWPGPEDTQQVCQAHEDKTPGMVLHRSSR